MIRKLKPYDVTSIEAILRKTENFREEDINVAMELVRISASDPEQRDYNIFVYEDEPEVFIKINTTLVAVGICFLDNKVFRICNYFKLKFAW